MFPGGVRRAPERFQVPPFLRLLPWVAWEPEKLKLWGAGRRLVGAGLVDRPAGRVGGKQAKGGEKGGPRAFGD